MPDIVLILPPNPILLTPEMHANLGVLYLGAALEQAGYKVQIADMRAHKEVDINLVPEADVYGITATTGEIEYARQIGRLLKEREPNCTTVIGGAHASLLPEDVEKDFDRIVIGEGEFAILDIMKGAGTRRIYQPRITDLDRLPFPARHLLAPKKRFSREVWPGERHGKGPRGADILTSRGCPFNCSFCANLMRTPVVFRSPENIAEEVKHLRDHYGIYHFKDVADNLTLNKKWLFKLCDALRPLGCHFRGHTRSDLIDSEIIEALKSCGFEAMGLGVESADDKVLTLVNKGETAEDHYLAARLIKDAGLSLRCYFMTGLPGETDETIELNKKFVQEIKPQWTLSTFQPYPTCEIWRHPERFGVELSKAPFSDYWNYTPSVISIDGVNAEQLERRRQEFYQWLTRKYSFSERGLTCV